MPIAGVIITTVQEEAENVLIKLKDFENVSTYGIHKENNIVAVFEGDTINELEDINNEITKEIKGVLGVFPAYVNYEDDEIDNNTVPNK